MKDWIILQTFPLLDFISVTELTAELILAHYPSNEKCRP